MSHPSLKWLVVILLGLALLARVNRIDQLLGFYYDQGRDAKVIWQLWHEKKLFLIGPTTGVEGIFLGPFYYYLLAPFYLAGGGNPVWPAVGLAVINVLAIGLVYLIAKRYFNSKTGLLAVLFLSFSFYLIVTQRWLANPNPLPLFAMVVVWCLLAIVHRRAGMWHWAGLGLGLGLSLQLEAASASFFLPATGLVFLLFRRSINWRWQWVGLAGSVFLATLLPQVVFDFRHGHILWQVLHNFVTGGRSFRPEITSRLHFYYEVFVNKFTPQMELGRYFVAGVVVLTIVSGKQLWSKTMAVLVIWWATPLVALLFYHGNYGYVWDYYFTGVYPVAVLLVAAILAMAAAKSALARGLVIGLVGLFLYANLPIVISAMTAGVDGPEHISLGNQRQAIAWVYQDSGDAEFNVDAYVPPVIPHAYDYLFLWLGTTNYHHLPSSQRQPRLYTLYEVDPPHPERLRAWLARQAGIGQVLTEAKFGGITVQRRERIK